MALSNLVSFGFFPVLYRSPLQVMAQVVELGIFFRVSKVQVLFSAFPRVGMGWAFHIQRKIADEEKVVP